MVINIFPMPSFASGDTEITYDDGYTVKINLSGLEVIDEPDLYLVVFNNAGIAIQYAEITNYGDSGETKKGNVVFTSLTSTTYNPRKAAGHDYLVIQKIGSAEIYNSNDTKQKFLYTCLLT